MKKIRKNVLGAALAVLLLLFTIGAVVGIIRKDYNDHQVRETETVQETSIPPSEEPGDGSRTSIRRIGADAFRIRRRGWK